MICDHCGQPFTYTKRDGIEIDLGDEFLNFCTKACLEAAVTKGSVKGHAFYRLELPEAAAAQLRPGQLLKIQ